MLSLVFVSTIQLEFATIQCQSLGSTEVLRVQGARIGLKINVKKAKSLRLGISEGEEVMLGIEEIDRADSFTYLGNFVRKDGGCSDYVKSRIARSQGGFFKVEKSLEE